MKKLNMCLCAARHEIPQAIDGAIFEKEIKDVTDVRSLEEKAEYHLFYVYTHKYDDIFLEIETHLNLYVTGLTVALVAVLNVCKQQNISVTLYHYDRDTNSYYSQEVK